METGWLGPKAAGWVQAAGRWHSLELVGVRGVCVRCWKMRFLLQAWMSPLQPARHTGLKDREVWHRISPSNQGSRSIPRPPPASFQLAKRSHLAGAFPKPVGFLELIPGAGRDRSQENVTKRVPAVAEGARWRWRGAGPAGARLPGDPAGPALGTAAPGVAVCQQQQQQQR